MKVEGMLGDWGALSRRSSGEDRGEYDQNALYTRMTFSKN